MWHLWQIPQGLGNIDEEDVEKEFKRWEMISAMKCCLLGMALVIALMNSQ